MKVSGLGGGHVPSPAVLRFLRIQAESLTFLASQRRTCWTSQTSRGNDQCATGKNAHIRGQGDGAFGHARRGFQSSSQGKTRLPPSSPSSSLAHTPRSLQGNTSFQRNTPIQNHRHHGTAGGTAGGARAFATTVPARTWLRPWHRVRQKKGAGPLQPNDLPAPSLLDDNASLSRIVKPTNELQLRCTEFDEHGNVTLVNGAFKKSELIAKVRIVHPFIYPSIHPSIRPSTAYPAPSIMSIHTHTHTASPATQD